ncbi:MAG: TolC family protein [Terracidiphilus sp.]
MGRWVVLLWCIGGLGLSAQEPLTLRQAIAQALGANPEARLARAGASEAKAGATLARTQLLPQFNFAEDISRGDDPVYVFGAKLRQQNFTQADFDVNALNRPLPVGNFETRVSGSWLAFDSFKTQRTIHGADLMRKSADSSARAVNQKIVFDVVEAYQAVLYAERLVAIAQHEQETAEALLDSVDDHVKAGLAVESDRMSAEVNVAARKQELIAAEGGLELAWAQLGVAMGAPDFEESTLAPIEAHEFPEDALNVELEAALKSRSDLTALGQAQGAQAAALSAARLDFGPRVNAYGNWEQDRGTFAGAGGNNWVAGVEVGIDLAPFSKRAQRAKEAAAKARVDAQVSAYQQQVRLEVTQAHIQRQTAEQSLETARAAVAQSAESLRILSNRYNAGLATITDLLRGEDAERQSQTNYWQAVYGNAVAYAQLLYAQGTLTPDAAEGLQ